MSINAYLNKCIYKYSILPCRTTPLVSFFFLLPREVGGKGGLEIKGAISKLLLLPTSEQLVVTAGVTWLLPFSYREMAFSAEVPTGVTPIVPTDLIAAGVTPIDFKASEEDLESDICISLSWGMLSFELWDGVDFWKNPNRVFFWRLFYELDYI